MRHVNEPAPSVLERRPDCPMRLDLAVRRAMAKDPADRFDSMDDFADELETCLAEVDGRADEGATMIVPAAPLRRRSAPLGRRAPGTGTLLLVGLIAAAVAVGAFLLLRDDGTRKALPGTGHSSKTVRLLGVGAEDPAGDGEHDEDAGKATDGDPASYWTTQDYRSFDKAGVGVVLDAGRPVALSRITVTSDLGDFPAAIRASRDSSSGFTQVSKPQEVRSRTTFHVDTNGKDYRYYEVWLQLPDGGRAHVNEVTAKT
jgi:hypothetical protein